jgi:hypothetical protein
MDLIPYVNLEEEMAADAIVIQYLKDKEIAYQFYAALCNMRWKKINALTPEEQIIDKLKGVSRDIWSCTWRHSGAIIAEIRNANYNTTEDYMDFYCSGSEGVVTYIVEECFERMGWKPYPYDDNI